MMTQPLSQTQATQIIEALGRGVPPQRGTTYYAVGHDKLMEGIRKFHLNGISDKGVIRFVSGSWGSGKTHFFRLMRELAFENGCLVSGVELSVNEAPLNRFERVFYSILRNVVTPSYFSEDERPQSQPFGLVLHEALVYLATGTHDRNHAITFEDLAKGTEKLMTCPAMDIDFRKIVRKYWETFLPDAPDPSLIEQTRAELLQWFSGEGSVGAYRKKFDVNKLVSRDTAKLILQSVAAFIKLAGYRGLVILFDEAEMSYSIMRKSALKDAHNNLLHLINNVESLTGLLLVYATTPDFYTDPKHGIVIYGALQGRIGQPDNRPPRALDMVWNLDAIQFELAQYQQVGRRIMDIFGHAYPDCRASLPTETSMDTFVEDLNAEHPAMSSIRFWRVLVTGCVKYLVNAMEGDVIDVKVIHRDVMKTLREV